MASGRETTFTGPFRHAARIESSADLVLRGGVVAPGGFTDARVRAAGRDVTIESSGATPVVPLSALGRLSIEAQNITQGGHVVAPFGQISLPDRQWPSRLIETAPRWLSTDLRDGNQSIIDPMDAVKKRRFFDLLLEIGVKEIEVGFPSAGATEFDFISGLVQNGRIPDDVTVQVLTQSRADLIRTSFDSLAGAKTAIVHVYNAVSPAWREIVFGMTREEVIGVAVAGARVLADEAARDAQNVDKLRLGRLDYLIGIRESIAALNFGELEEAGILASNLTYIALPDSPRSRLLLLQLNPYIADLPDKARAP